MCLGVFSIFYTPALLPVFLLAQLNSKEVVNCTPPLCHLHLPWIGLNLSKIDYTYIRECMYFFA